MAHQTLDVLSFLEKAQTCPVLDVRSPGEFQHAHLPGALPFPLFTDEERKVVGTAYKKESREKAIQWGLRYFGPKLLPMVEAAEKIAATQASPKNLLVHCWRGGMRSAAVAWLLDLYGFKIGVLKGGYKAYRQWVLATLAQPLPLQIIGGYTGSGKTELLQALRESGEAVLDLEELAAHRGSAFGNLGMPQAPSQEMFENRLAHALQELHQQLAQRPGRVVFVEDESQRIGEVNVPASFFQQMRSAPLVFLDIPFPARLEQVVKVYGCFAPEKLAHAIGRIQKKLGGLETKMALQHLEAGDLHHCFAVLLRYYDRFYVKGKNKRPQPEQQVRTLEVEAIDAVANAQLILQTIAAHP